MVSLGGSPPLENLPPSQALFPTFLSHRLSHQSQFWSIQLQKQNMPALAQNMGGCKKYAEIRFSSGEKNHVDMYNGYEYYWKSNQNKMS